MAIARIAQPFIVEEGLGASCVQKDAVPEVATNTGGVLDGMWLNNSFVFTSGTGASVVLNRCKSAATLIYGMAPAKGYGAVAQTPPTSMFGNTHFPFDVRDRIIEINITAATDAAIGTINGVTWNGGGTGGVALSPGAQFGIRTITTAGNYLHMQFLDVSNVTQKVFEVVAIAPNQALTDNNPRVWVKVIPTVIQG